MGNQWALVAVIVAAVTTPFAVIGIISWRSERRAKRLAKRRKQRIRFDEAPDERDFKSGGGT